MYLHCLPELLQFHANNFKKIYIVIYDVYKMLTICVVPEINTGDNLQKYEISYL
jgi:hypothetical protein